MTMIPDIDSIGIAEQPIDRKRSLWLGASIIALKTPELIVSGIWSAARILGDALFRMAIVLFEPFATLAAVVVMGLLGALTDDQDAIKHDLTLLKKRFQKGV